MKLILATTFLITAVAAMNANALAQGVHITSSEGYHENINRIQMSSTPLTDAINLVADLGRVSIYVDRESIEKAGISLQTAVTATFRNSTVGEILKEILPSGLAVAKQESSLVIATTNRIDSGKRFELKSGNVSEAFGIVDVGQMAAGEAFARTMPVHFQHMPLEAAVQMLVGLAGKHAQFNRAAGQHRFRIVTMHRDHSTIRENLDELLEAAGLTWKIAGHVVIIKEK